MPLEGIEPGDLTIEGLIARLAAGTVREVIMGTNPTLEGDEESAVARLVAQGPPDEDVGLDAYPIDPRLNPSGRPFEPHPAMRGARS